MFAVLGKGLCWFSNSLVVLLKGWGVTAMTCKKKQKGPLSVAGIGHATARPEMAKKRNRLHVATVQAACLITTTQAGLAVECAEGGSVGE